MMLALGKMKLMLKYMDNTRRYIRRSNGEMFEFVGSKTARHLPNYINHNVCKIYVQGSIHESTTSRVQKKSRLRAGDRFLIIYDSFKEGSLIL